jgi:hypothetical protein
VRQDGTSAIDVARAAYERPPARPFYFDRTALARLAHEHAESYANARPFPHVVLDGFLPDDVHDQVVAEMEAAPPDAWIVMRGGEERKLALRDEACMGDVSRHVFAQLTASAFVTFLEALTGIRGLIPNVHIGSGGGLFQNERGCMMPVHVDYNRNDHLGLDRRVNLLLYLNRDWSEQDGGHLELWDEKAEHCVRRILPIANRCVVFSGSDRTFHGHPQPITCAPGRTRKSLTVYYLTNGRPEDERAPAHDTLFRRRPRARAAAFLRKLAQGLTPPLVAGAAKRFRGRR